MNQNISTFLVLVGNYVLDTLRIAFYTPSILFIFSVVVVLFTFLKIPIFIPDGDYDAGDIIRAYGLITFFLSFLLAGVERIVNKRITVAQRNRFVIAAGILAFAAIGTFLFLVTKVEMDVVSAFLFSAFLFGISLVGIVIGNRLGFLRTSLARLPR